METWFDPMEMFRQIAPDGVVDRKIHVRALGKDLGSQLFDSEDDEYDAAAACPWLGKD